MHLYFLTRGKRRFVRSFIDDLEDIYLPYEYEKGKKASLQVNPREVTLWECTFPEEHLELMINKIGTNDYNGQYKIKKRIKDFFIKLLGLKVIPKKWSNIVGTQNRYNAVGVEVIGTKKDSYTPDGIEKI